MKQVKQGLLLESNLSSIGHVISSIDKNSGGTSRSVTQLISYLSHLNEKLIIKLHTGISNEPIIQEFNNNSNELIFYKTGILANLRGFNKVIQKSQPSLLHGHGLWQQPVHQMAIYAQGHNIPYIISPRGMLEPWALNQGKLKKQLAIAWFQKIDLQKAICIHATSDMEASNIRSLGFTQPIAIIPNGVPLEHLSLKANQPQTKTLLFLSRIHPKKGLELLIEAWAQLDSDLKAGWYVQIIGNGDSNYIEQLKKLIRARGEVNTIHIKPPFFGPDKVKAYHDANVFVLPTYSENFGIVVAEALACGTPVITTQGTPWEDLISRGCGWWIPSDIDSLKQTLNNVLQLPTSVLHQMGLKGRKLIEEKYSMPFVAEMMLKLYEWILYDTEIPEFVYLD